MSSNADARGHLDLLVLTVLAHGPAHGYRIIKLLAEHSGGALDLPEGSLYPALRRLEATGWVAGAWQSESGRRRRVYSLSAAGRELLEEQQAAWARFAAGVDAVLGWHS